MNWALTLSSNAGGQANIVYIIHAREPSKNLPNLVSLTTRLRPSAKSHSVYLQQDRRIQAHVSERAALCFVFYVWCNVPTKKSEGWIRRKMQGGGVVLASEWIWWRSWPAICSRQRVALSDLVQCAWDAGQWLGRFRRKEVLG